MKTRPKIAAIATIYHKYSHAQHIVDRFLEGYGWNSCHHYPEMQLVSLYVEQLGENDLSRERLGRYPSVAAYSTIAEALTLGGDKLAVDGVLLIGEHGDYPANEKGQRLYPRYEHFKEMAEVYERSRRGVPTFNDKHLSWNWEWAREMYDISQELDFPFMAGSSLPVTWRTPSIEMPYDVPVSEAVCVGYGGIDSYDFHALETLQCMVERRKGGETGVKWLQAYRGETFWEAYHAQLWSRELFEAALCRSHTLTPSRAGFNDIFPTLDELKELVKDPIAYHYEHYDGLKSTMFLMNGLVQDFNFAATIGTDNTVLSTQMYLPMPPVRTTLANFFSPLVNNIEKMFETGRVPYPVERTLLTTGLVAAGVDSCFAGGEKQETPHLDIRYEPTRESTFWRT